MSLHLPEKIRVDNFAGGGGASTAIELATGMPVDVAINHNAQALGMHALNHPWAQHFVEDVFQVDPQQVCRGRPVEVAWFSPDCTHHSKARGGKPRSQNVRGLAWVAVRWGLDVRPDLMPLENVEEFKDWGPLDDDGQPIKSRMGETFEAFCGVLSKGVSESHPGYVECLRFLKLERGTQKAKRLAQGLGYDVDFRELRACDYGAPTTRRRLFMINRCDGLPIVWPKPTHGPIGSSDVLSGALLPYKSAVDCIDWSVPTKSIFHRSKPLAEKSLARIARGLDKFLFSHPDPYVMPGSDVAPIVCDSSPFTSGSEPLVASFLVKHFGGNYSGAGIPMTSPIDTITTTDHHALVSVFLVKYYSEGGQWADVRDPLHTIPTKDRLGIVVVQGTPHRIIDIGMRMLTPEELFRAQGFPSGYNFLSYLDAEGVVRKLSKAAAVRLCGNSVSPPVAEALLRANLSLPGKCRSAFAA